MRLRLVSFVILLASLLVTDVCAQTIPNFPSCTNPQGSVKVSYSEGTHGIVGNGGTFTGSDTVYTLSDNTSTQCFCADNGDGTQTNWWHADSLTETEIQVLKNQGWITVPNGQLWGLAEGEWLAYNSPYSCLGGEVQAASTQIDDGDVLGLATTGNIITIYILTAFGMTSLILGLLLKRNR